MAETVEFGQYPLQVRPAPLRSRSWNKGESIIVAPPPSRGSSLQNWDQLPEKVDTELPPADRGSGAWKFLFAASMIEGFMFGFPLNYGVFQNYYSAHPPYVGNTNLSTIGTFGTCFYFLGAPIATYLVRRYQQWQRQTIWIGFTITIIGLAASGWAHDFGSLVATQGVIYGMGILIMYYPIFNLLNEWFIERRGLALGVICASSGITGLFFPFVLEILLSKYGSAWTLRVSALALLLLCGPCMPLFQSRYPTYDDVKAPETNNSFFKMPLFYFFTLATLLQGLGFFFPAIYLPSYATSVGLSTTIGTLLLVIYCIAQILGQMATGYISDLHIRRLGVDGRVPVEILVFISPFIAIFYGASAGGFAVLWARMATTLSPNPTLALTTFSYFACMKGIGNVVTGPVSSVLLSAEVSRDEYGIGKFKAKAGKSKDTSSRR
ncbi:MAG: hypothetical protein LQ343_000659 [Gyalolechia ehrenbergii]|nr:MAG: hypothetical protein LQ343_000659 [Gyalolechia ehrenbergii]